MKIGFLDSGMGGLSVMHRAFQKLPPASYIYYADEVHVPYGEKTIEQIRQYCDEAVGFMVDKGAKSIVIACNTATSAAITYLREKYKIPMVGMEPAIKKAVDYDNHRRILALATPVTVRGEKMKRLVDKVGGNDIVDLLATPELVRFAEKGDFGSEAVMKYLEEVFVQIDFTKYSSVVLGCTHFNYFKESMRKIIPEHVIFVDGIEGTVNHLIHEIGMEDEMEEADYNKEIIDISKKIEETPVYFSGKLVESGEEKMRVKSYFKQLDNVQRIR